MLSETERDPRHHTQKMKAPAGTIVVFAMTSEMSDEPQLKAKFETFAEAEWLANGLQY